MFGNFFSVTLRMQRIYIYIYIRVGYYKKTQTKEETSECKELEGKGQALLSGKGTIGCYKSGVDDCMRATAYVIMELCY